MDFFPQTQLLLSFTFYCETGIYHLELIKYYLVFLILIHIILF